MIKYEWDDKYTLIVPVGHPRPRCLTWATLAEASGCGSKDKKARSSGMPMAASTVSRVCAHHRATQFSWGLPTQQSAQVPARHHDLNSPPELLPYMLEAELWPTCIVA